ncbi:MAG: heavy metal-binding domain-containing protein, partial [Usitatibacter sp.]
MSNARKAVLAIIAGALVASGLGSGYWLAMHRMAAEKTAAPAPAPEKKPLYWHDPMVPGQKFDKPGKSPYMDMMLVPVYGDEAAADSSVKISSQVAQNLGVRT